MKHYTTVGEIRGHCGHKHRSAHAAGACLRKDQAGCKGQGGYSDRVAVAVDDYGEQAPLSALDQDAADQAECGYT